MSSQCHETGDDDEDQDNELENTEEVLQSKTPFDGGSVQDEGEGDAGETNGAQSPSFGLYVGREEDVFSEHQRVSSGPCEQHSVGCEHGGDEEAGSAEEVFEVVFLASVFRDSLQTH